MTEPGDRRTSKIPPRPKALNEDNLGRAFKWSFIAHLALGIAIILKSLVFPSEPIVYTPTLRVDLVGLPDILKKDLKQPLPLPEIEPEKPETAKPKEADPVLAEAADPDEMVLKPEKRKKKDETKAKAKEATDDKKRSDRINSALARIKALNKITNMMGEEEPAPIKGNKISKGTSLSGDAKESDEASYYDLIRDRLQQNWGLPPWIQRQNYSARVQVFIDQYGKIRSFKFIKPSGNEQFDSEVKRTLTVSEPYPVPPAELRNSVLSNGITIGFPI